MNKIKVDNKMLKDFLGIMAKNKEFLFGDNEQLRKQLETCLNNQGYWSGCFVRVYYDNNSKTFRTEGRI